MWPVGKGLFVLDQCDFVALSACFTSFFAFKLVRLSCDNSRHFLQIFQEKQRETLMFF